MIKKLNKLSDILKCFLLLLLIIEAVAAVSGNGNMIASASPSFPDTSYWGYVTVDSVPKTNVLVTVIDSSGKEVAHATSTKDALYQILVTWDDTNTTVDEGVMDGETLTFNVGGKTAISKKIDPKGTTNRLDLQVTSSSTTTSSNNTASSTATTSSKTTISPIATISPEMTTSPIASPDVTAITTKISETPAPVTTKSAPGFGFVLALAGLMGVILRKREEK